MGLWLAWGRTARHALRYGPWRMVPGAKKTWRPPQALGLLCVERSPAALRIARACGYGKGLELWGFRSLGRVHGPGKTKDAGVVFAPRGARVVAHVVAPGLRGARSTGRGPRAPRRSEHGSRPSGSEALRARVVALSSEVPQSSGHGSQLWALRHLGAQIRAASSSEGSQSTGRGSEL